MAVEVVAGGGTMFTGADVPVYQAIVLKNAIKMWANHKIKANRMYTPANMLATAARITGKPYKRGQYAQAQADLEAWINQRKEEREAAEQEQAA